jgi:hypothetical protein
LDALQWHADEANYRDFAAQYDRGARARAALAPSGTAGATAAPKGET